LFNKHQNIIYLPEQRESNVFPSAPGCPTETYMKIYASVYSMYGGTLLPSCIIGTQKIIKRFLDFCNEISKILSKTLKFYYEKSYVM
jgi:hypothetical protein